MNILYQTSDRNTFGVPDGQLMTFDASLQFITDRTQQDVAYVQQLASKLIAGTATDFEKAEWNSTLLKGAYNYTDLNRVTAAMEYLKLRLEQYGYTVPGYQRFKVQHSVTGVSTDAEYDPYLWYEFDWPTPETLTIYLLNVSAIRAVLNVTESTPNVPNDMLGLMVKEANDIEVILMDVYRQINVMTTTFISCGEALSGGDNL